MENGWIKLHRKLLDNPLILKPSWFLLWVLLLLLANHQDKEMIWNGKKIVVKKGQFITGRKKLAKLSGISETTVERILKYLENEHQIGQQKTTKYRLITILNWETYQVLDNKRTTNGQQTDTNKNDNKDKNNTSEQSSQVSQLIKAFETINPACKKMYGNKTQRKACESLIEIYGFNRVLTVIEKTLPKTNKMTAEFFPNIGTPHQLFDKWQKMEDAIHAYKARNNKLSNNVAFT